MHAIIGGVGIAVVHLHGLVYSPMGQHASCINILPYNKNKDLSVSYMYICPKESVKKVDTLFVTYPGELTWISYIIDFYLCSEGRHTWTVSNALF